MKLEISAELAQAILNYLATKPYSEVFELIAAIQQLKPPAPPEPEPPKQ